jgi:hypothetical protein
MQVLLFKQSSGTAAQRRAYFRLVSSTDGITPVTGATGTGFISKNGAAATATSGSVVEIDAGDQPGMYYIELTAGEIDTLGHVVVTFDNGSSLPATVLGMVLPDDPFTAASTLTQFAEALMKLDISTITGEADKSLVNAVRMLINKKEVTNPATNEVTVYLEDDTTPAFTIIYAGTDPVITEVTPTF